MNIMYGTFLVIQVIVSYMATEKKGQVIIFPGSVGRYPMKNSSIYLAFKFAITVFAVSLTEEFKRSGVTFTLMHLAGIDTHLWDSDTVDLRVQKDKMLVQNMWQNRCIMPPINPKDPCLMR